MVRTPNGTAFVCSRDGSKKTCPGIGKEARLVHGSARCQCGAQAETYQTADGRTVVLRHQR